MKVLAAMSGGVDSAVAAARAVDAGHDVTGVHLALSKNPQSYRSGARGCCSKEDAHDARRAADVLGIPFYVWDLSDRFAADVVDDFVAEYAAGRTPNPCLRCNEKIKFAAVLDRGVALGFDAVCTGHYARLVRDRRRRRAAPAADDAKDQSYVLGVLNQDQLRRVLLPAGRITQVRRSAPRPADRGLAVADKPDSHDICFIADGDTAGFLIRPAGRAGRRHRRPSTAPRSGEHSGTPPVHHRAAPRSAAGRPGRRRPAAVRAGHLPGDQHRHRRSAATRSRSARSPRIRPTWTGDRPADAVVRTVQLRAHGQPLPATVPYAADEPRGDPGRSRRRESRRVRPSCSTTAPGWSAARRSPRPPVTSTSPPVRPPASAPGRAPTWRTRSRSPSPSARICPTCPSCRPAARTRG